MTVTELNALSRVTEGPIVCHEEVAGPARALATKAGLATEAGGN